MASAQRSCCASAHVNYVVFFRVEEEFVANMLISAKHRASTLGVMMLLVCVGSTTPAAEDRSASEVVDRLHASLLEAMLSLAIVTPIFLWHRRAAKRLPAPEEEKDVQG